MRLIVKRQDIYDIFDLAFVDTIGVIKEDKKTEIRLYFTGHPDNQARIELPSLEDKQIEKLVKFLARDKNTDKVVTTAELVNLIKRRP